MVCFAKRVRASEVTSTVTSVSSASLSLKTRSEMRRISDAPSKPSRELPVTILRPADGRCARVFRMGLIDLARRLFRKRHADAHVSKTRGRGAVARTHHLLRLAFATIRRAPQSPVITRANGIATVPEFGGDAAVAGVLDHAALFAAFNLPADFGGKLKMVAAVVNRPGTVRFHVNGIVCIGNQIAKFPRAGLEADVRHADDRQAIPALGAHGAAAAIEADVRSGFAIRKIAGKEAFANDVGALRGKHFVVIAESTETRAQ